MGADILIAAIAVPADRDRPLDFERRPPAARDRHPCRRFLFRRSRVCARESRIVQDSRGPVWMTHHARPGRPALERITGTQRIPRTLSAAGALMVSEQGTPTVP